MYIYHNVKMDAFCTGKQDKLCTRPVVTIHIRHRHCITGNMSYSLEN